MYVYNCDYAGPVYSVATHVLVKLGINQFFFVLWNYLFFTKSHVSASIRIKVCIFSSFHFYHFYFNSTEIMTSERAGIGVSNLPLQSRTRRRLFDYLAIAARSNPYTPAELSRIQSNESWCRMLHFRQIVVIGRERWCFEFRNECRTADSQVIYDASDSDHRNRDYIRLHRRWM